MPNGLAFIAIALTLSRTIVARRNSISRQTIHHAWLGNFYCGDCSQIINLIIGDHERALHHDALYVISKTDCILIALPSPNTGIIKLFSHLSCDCYLLLMSVSIAILAKMTVRT
jgi:hypothetical protein